jgi:uncharacterized membrane protein SirB2
VEAFYPDIRAVHIAAVIVSGVLFVLRFAGHNLLNSRWPMAFTLRTIVWSVDTILLTAALMLMTIVQVYPFVDGWLTMKVLLLVVYIVLARLAFTAEQKRMRLLSMVTAIAVFAFIITIARAHSPLGIFATI